MKPTSALKRCLIKQPVGLGDILFCQKIADMVIERGYYIWWPVIDQYYACVTEHIKKPGITFCRQSDDFPMKEYYSSGICKPAQISDANNLYLPLQHADVNYPGLSVLKAKYKMVGLDYSSWHTHIDLARNQEREHMLYYDVLGLQDEEEYSFVNLWYGSPPHSLKKTVDIDADYPKLEMRAIDGYTIFDWCKVIENANQIFCVDTSLFYIIDIVDLKTTHLEAYSKFEPANYIHIDGLFSKPWKYN